jgi:hypothetical protein
MLKQKRLMEPTPAPQQFRESQLSRRRDASWLVVMENALMISVTKTPNASALITETNLPASSKFQNNVFLNL